MYRGERGLRYRRRAVYFVSSQEFAERGKDRGREGETVLVNLVKGKIGRWTTGRLEND
jgi:hypothetical protein